jgi:hypothetical protein
VADDEEANTRKDGEVGGGGLWCYSNFGSSPDDGGGRRSSSAASRAGPMLCEMVWQRMDGGQAPEMGKHIRVAGEVHFIAVWTGADMKRL